MGEGAKVVDMDMEVRAQNRSQEEFEEGERWWGLPDSFDGPHVRLWIARKAANRQSDKGKNVVKSFEYCCYLFPNSGYFVSCLTRLRKHGRMDDMGGGGGLGRLFCFMGGKRLVRGECVSNGTLTTQQSTVIGYPFQDHTKKPWSVRVAMKMQKFSLNESQFFLKKIYI